MKIQPATEVVIAYQRGAEVTNGSPYENRTRLSRLKTWRPNR